MAGIADFLASIGQRPGFNPRPTLSGPTRIGQAPSLFSRAKDALVPPQDVAAFERVRRSGLGSLLDDEDPDALPMPASRPSIKDALPAAPAAPAAPSPGGLDAGIANAPPSEKPIIDLGPVRGIPDFIRRRDEGQDGAPFTNASLGDAAQAARSAAGPTPLSPAADAGDVEARRAFGANAFKMPSQQELDTITANAPNSGRWDFDTRNPERNSRDAGEVIRQRVTRPGIADAAAMAGLKQEQEKADNPYGEIEAKSNADLQGIAAASAAQRDQRSGIDADRYAAINKGVAVEHAKIDQLADQTLKIRLSQIPPDLTGIKRAAMEAQIRQNLEQEKAHAKEQAAVGVYAAYGIQKSPTLATADSAFGGLPQRP